MSSAQLTLQIIFHFFARLCLLSIYLCGCIFTDLITTYVQTGKEMTWPKQHAQVSSRAPTSPVPAEPRAPTCEPLCRY